MTGKTLRHLAIFAFAFTVPHNLVASDLPEPQLARLKRHVQTLASPAYGGRRGEGARKAEAYVLAELKSLGLGPLFGESFTQDIPSREPGTILGRNVGARLVGSDPAKRDEWVILSAHYDHLGVRNGVLYPGADDNASAVAMMLEVARSLVESPMKPARSIMFVSFDLEEDGLFGSRYFADQPPVPLEKVALFLTADLIGRSLGGVCDPYVFVMGTERIPRVRTWIDRAAKEKPITVGLLGSDVLLIDRSDYGPFRTRKIPYMFFSTGENPRYHSPDDTPETLDYPKLESISRMICDLMREIVHVKALPTWQTTPDNPFSEIVTIREVMKTLLAHKDELKIKPGVVGLMTRTSAQLDVIVERGTITPAERTSVVRIAQLVLFSVL